jgi:hypothetical protein
MKLRNKVYLRRKKAIQDMAQFKDLHSFLKAGFELSKSIVVKKDILNTLFELKGQNRNLSLAS